MLFRSLVDRYGLVSLPAVSVLRALKRKVASKGSTAFIGYGAPILDGPGAGKRAVNMGSRFVLKIDEEGINLADPDLLRTLNPLPGTERELSAMATALKASKRDVLLGAAATETAVRRDANLGKARIIAFATHGVLPREVSGIEEPGLVLTPPAAPSPSDDGLLTASEVSKLTLNADWVLLSACNTASADGTPGADSLSSLSRAFLYAGAQALLASHWRVSDDATAALTVETLAGRSTGSLNRADALKAAMLAVRTGKRADGSAVAGWNDGWAHPSAWAPFTVISNGDE